MGKKAQLRETRTRLRIGIRYEPHLIMDAGKNVMVIDRKRDFYGKEIEFSQPRDVGIMHQTKPPPGGFFMPSDTSGTLSASHGTA